MSAIGDGYLVETPDLAALVTAAMPVRRFLRLPLDGFPAFLATRCRALGMFDYSGFMLTTVLAFLDERGVKLGKSHRDIADEIARLRGAMYVVFITDAERAEALPRMDAIDPSAQELERYDCELCEREPEGQGEALVAAYAYLRRAVAAASPSAVAMVMVG